MSIQDFNYQKMQMGKIEPQSVDYNNEQLRNIINQLRAEVDTLKNRVTELENKE